MELHYVRLFFTFTLEADLAEPYYFFSCRADFDAAFRRTLSCRRGDCTGCRSAVTCPYPANFGQILAKDPEGVRRHQKPPLPFVFQFPIIPPAPNKGKSLEFALTLFGNAALEASRYIAAVRFLLERIKAAISNVEAECPGGGRTVVLAVDQPALPLLSPLDPTVSGPLHPDQVDILFVTPLKLMHEGRLLKHIRFTHFARALMRRVSSLAYYYEGAEPQLDYRWLSQCSEAVETSASECRFVSWGGHPSGIVGTVRFRGDLEPFHQLIQSGPATHLGKGASFGYGCYRIVA